MAPNIIGNSFLLAETTIEQEPPKRTTQIITPPLPSTSQKLSKQSLEVVAPAVPAVVPKKSDEYQLEIVWRNVIAFTILHMLALYAVYLMISQFIIMEYIVGHIMGIFAGFGVTAGAHRLWAHKSYKAKVPLRIILMIFQTMAFQNCIHEWVRDHRVHHKFCDTHADPHNSRRGFFFSHMGWLMCKKHPEVRAKGKTIDMSDLEADPVVMFQKEYYMFLMPVFCFIVPALGTYYVFGRPFWQCFFISSVLRYVISLHYTWLVNSAAHIWGMRPFDKGISPSENILVAVLANGEGWHNYHHVFPWDYKAAELGSYMYNFSTAFIDFFALIGWAYDMKTVSRDMIQKRCARTGDGNHVEFNGQRDKNLVVELNEKHNHENLDSAEMVWGWDDKDMTNEDKNDAFIYKKVD